MTILTNVQAEELKNALAEAFDPATLPWMVRASLGQELYRIVDVGQPLETVVGELLSWVERRGPGTLEALLQGALAAQPNRRLLRNFCDQYFPNISSSLSSDHLIHSLNLGLTLLSEMRNEASVRETVGVFRADLDTTRRQIGILKKYKALHDSLHELQMALDAIIDALGHLRTNPSSLLGLRMYALALGRIAKSARAQVADLPTRVEEENWIDDLDACIRDMTNLASPPAKPDDPARAEDIGGRLVDLLSNTRRINDLLVITAHGLRLDSFTQTMETIVSKLKGYTGETDNTLRLFESLTSVGVLRARIDGLVAEHNEWQVFNNDLQVAEHSRQHQPPARMPKWEKFKSKLTGLCAAYAQADWSRELLQRMGKWVAATPSAKPDDAEKINGEITFAEFRRICVYRYYDVDKELNELSTQVLEVAQPIDTLLKAIR